MMDFLSRWARRKQATQAARRAQGPPDADSPIAAEQAAGSRPPETRDTSDESISAPKPGVPEFDPGSLPAIESITAETDIRAFLRAGVPTEVTRAALRRVWTSDPKIRNFVGLADYDWDFNAPGSMAGFGPLEGAEALRDQMARRLVPDEAAEMSDRDHGAKQEVGTSTIRLVRGPSNRPKSSPKIRRRKKTTRRKRRTSRRISSTNIPQCNNSRKNPRTFNQLLAADMDGPCRSPEVTWKS